MKGASSAAGLVILIAAWSLSLAGQSSFAVHMVAHMAVVAVAAPLIAIGLSGTPLDFASRLSWITPLTASLLDLVAVWFWHLPQMRLLADQSIAAALFEQASFLAVGLLLWLSCLAASGLAGAAGLLLTSMHMTLLGVLLALAPRPLYRSQEAICFGLSLPATLDQQIGGVAMLLIGAAAYLIGGVVLLHRVLADRADVTEQVP